MAAAVRDIKPQEEIYNDQEYIWKRRRNHILCRHRKNVLYLFLSKKISR